MNTFSFDEAYDLWMKTPAGGRYSLCHDQVLFSLADAWHFYAQFSVGNAYCATTFTLLPVGLLKAGRNGFSYTYQFFLDCFPQGMDVWKLVDIGT